MARCLALPLLLLGLSAGAAADGSCVVVPMAGTDHAGSKKSWCQVNCPVAGSVTDGHAICPFYDPSSAAASCGGDGFSAGAAEGCNQGFSPAACPPMGSDCIDCVRSEMLCSTCNAAAICSQSNGFSVSRSGVTGSLGTCDHSDGELTTCAGREATPCGYLCTGRCERGFSSSWRCDFAGDEQVITRCERTTVDDPEAECDLRSCENGCLSAFLVQVEKGNVTGWDLSFPLGTTSGASSAGRGSLASLALSVAAACFAVRLA